MTVEEMIEALDDLDRELAWQGTPSGPELRQQVKEWAFGLFASWDTPAQVEHLQSVGARRAADVLGMAIEPDRRGLLAHLPIGFRT